MTPQLIPLVRRLPDNPRNMKGRNQEVAPPMPKSFYGPGSTIAPPYLDHIVPSHMKNKGRTPPPRVCVSLRLEGESQP